MGHRRPPMQDVRSLTFQLASRCSYSRRLAIVFFVLGGCSEASRVRCTVLPSCVLGEVVRMVRTNNKQAFSHQFSTSVRPAPPSSQRFRSGLPASSTVRRRWFVGKHCARALVRRGRSVRLHWQSGIGVVKPAPLSYLSCPLCPSPLQLVLRDVFRDFCNGPGQTGAGPAEIIGSNLRR